MRRFKRAEIRAEGIRRGFAGDGLDDFVAILTRLDDEHARAMNDKSAQDFSAAIARAERNAAQNRKNR